jgi:hypothetical protein
MNVSAYGWPSSFLTTIYPTITQETPDMAAANKRDRIVEDKDEIEARDANRDPISGTPGAHPVGTGVGAAAAGAAGAAIGTAVGGPIGGVAGAVIGSVAGGLGGKGVAEAVNPTVEDEYWRVEYKNRPYARDTQYVYEDYRPAYRYGWENYGKYTPGRFEEVESDLQRGWDRARGTSRLSWDRAREAARDAWNRVERAIPGDFDKDGR